MNRFKNILFVADHVGVESKSFLSALSLAKANNAALTVMDVIEPIECNAEIQAQFGTNLVEILHDRRLAELKTMTEPHCDEHSVVRSKVAIGKAFLEVIRAVIHNQFDLVIKSSELTEGQVSSLLGPNDLHLLRKCPCPVWIDREEARHPYRKILAAIDPYNDEDKELARTILDLAFSIEPAAEVHIVSAWRLPGESSLRYGIGRVSQVELRSVLTGQQRRHAIAVDRLLSDYGMSLSDPRVHFHKSKAMPLITQLVETLPADLVVTGTVGRTGIPGFFIGNTAESLINEIKIPVLAVKPEKFVSPVTIE